MSFNADLAEHVTLAGIYAVSATFTATLTETAHLGDVYSAANPLAVEGLMLPWLLRRRRR